MLLRVLNKDQAIAAADALILRVETERRQRLERRTARIVMLYPVLRCVPPEEREALVWAAFRVPVTRWVIGGIALVAMLTGLWAVFGGPSPGMDPAQQRPYPLVLLAAASILPAQYLCIRAFLRREVPRRFPKGDHPAARPDA